MAQITSREELYAWLKDKPTDWAQVIAVRAALRVLPIVTRAISKDHSSNDQWYSGMARTSVQATYLLWAINLAPENDANQEVKLVANAIYHYAEGYISVDWLRDSFSISDYVAAEAACHAIYSALISHLPEAVEAAADAARAAYGMVSEQDGHSIIWKSVNDDAAWLLDNERFPSSVFRLIAEPLWLVDPIEWPFYGSISRLLNLDPTYQVWIDWYNRRIEGHDAAFDIPGDTRRVEDKKILARLADATDEDFWDKGATYVNTTLQNWIDEARERVGPKTIPPQEPDAIAYGLNGQGKLDRLPTSDQTHLRDIPDQQSIYRDVREAALELQGEGQRLGVRLERALGRFLTSIPENFADAECYSVWRDGNALRRIHLAHRAVAGGKDYDDKRLDPAMAEMLGDVLDRYNLFAFGDDGLRAKDEAAIPPQERVKAVDEAAKAAPLMEALLASPEIMTEIVRDDLLADQADQALPEGDPYDDQALIQSNKSMRNRIAALLSGVGRQVKQSGKSVREGAERAVGALIVSEVAGVTTLHQPILAFAATHFAALKDYAGAAYSNSLQWLWDAISNIGDKF